MSAEGKKVKIAVSDDEMDAVAGGGGHVLTQDNTGAYREYMCEQPTVYDMDFFEWVKESIRGQDITCKYAPAEKRNCFGCSYFKTIV